MALGWLWVALRGPYFCFLLSAFWVCQSVALGGLSVQGSGLKVQGSRFRVQGSMFGHQHRPPPSDFSFQLSAFHLFRSLPSALVHSSPARRTPGYEGAPAGGSQVLRRSLSRGSENRHVLARGDLPPVSPSPPG